jgi:hypothetical protein
VPARFRQVDQSLHRLRPVIDRDHTTRFGDAGPGQFVDRLVPERHFSLPHRRANCEPQLPEGGQAHEDARETGQQVRFGKNVETWNPLMVDS